MRERWVTFNIYDYSKEKYKKKKKVHEPTKQ